MQALFAEHIAHLTKVYEDALSLLRAEGGEAGAVLVYSGSEQFYYGDDRAIPFQAFGHFLHWLPVNQPEQFLLFRPGAKPVYLQVVRSDYWYEQTIEVASWWADAFDIVQLDAPEKVRGHLPGAECAWLGGNPELAGALGIRPQNVNPAPLSAALDFARAVKTDYELAQLRAANRLAAAGHRAARECFFEGGNEYMIHRAFLAAGDMLESDSPYTNIVALDEKSAILHYQRKRRNDALHSKVLLIDAGCRVNGYGSDVTRTSVRKSAHPVFRQLVEGVDRLEQGLAAEVKPGKPCLDMHLCALAGIADLLIEHGICAGSAAELVELEVPQLFMPHGVGHLLGLQVHDVAGHQRDPEGNSAPPPAHSPALRNTRIMTENMVFTIEPGCYFIPILLEPERSTRRGRLINWPLVDALYPCGGIRVEDNVRVTADGHENLTRPCFETP